MKTPYWNIKFQPCYSPKDMLDRGVFEGIYTAAIEGLPKEWYDHPKVLPRGSKPDPSINEFGVKSRLSLKEWEKNGWTTEHSPLGWWQWYCHYWLGRRIPEEDKWQIDRWYSFCARHQAQISASKDRLDLSKRLKQRQALLQWGWDSTKKFEGAVRHEALANLSRRFPDNVKIPPNKPLLW